MIAAAILLSLSGCMSAAHTMNLLSEEEAARLSREADAIDITPDPGEEYDVVTPAPDASAPTALPLKVTPAGTAPAGTAPASTTPAGTAPVGATSTPDTTPAPSPTATPAPTASPKPQNTPAYTVKDIEDTAAFVYAKSVNLRKGPGTSYDIVKELSQLTPLTITGETGDWYRVKAGSTTGFVIAEYIKRGTAPTPTPAATPKPTAKPTATPTAKPTATPTAKPTATPAPSSDTSAPSGAVNAYDYFSDTGSFTAAELLLVAQVSYLESDRSDADGLAAVANVIYNRVMDSRFPSTVNGVVFQKYQFTVADSDIYYVKPSSKAVSAVKRIFVTGDMLLGSNVCYFRPASKGTDRSGYTYAGSYGGNAYFSKN